MYLSKQFKLGIRTKYHENIIKRVAKYYEMGSNTVYRKVETFALLYMYVYYHSTLLHDFYTLMKTILKLQNPSLQIILNLQDTLIDIQLHTRSMKRCHLPVADDCGVLCCLPLGQMN